MKETAYPRIPSSKNILARVRGRMQISFRRELIWVSFNEALYRCYIVVLLHVRKRKRESGNERVLLNCCRQKLKNSKIRNKTKTIFNVFKNKFNSILFKNSK